MISAGEQKDDGGNSTRVSLHHRLNLASESPFALGRSACALKPSSGTLPCTHTSSPAWSWLGLPPLHALHRLMLGHTDSRPRGPGSATSMVCSCSDRPDLRCRADGCWRCCWGRC
ncbi:hypothetical protein M758_UG019300 [Ceratodon purpureus]|nr:hypothetical protein M758_UG019300 [Ceratodon purpureus]